MTTKSDNDLKTLVMRSVEKDPSGCWVWTGGVSYSSLQRGKPYGYVWAGGQRLVVRRLVYRLWGRRPSAEGYSLRCTCDNTLCVNPEHLVRSGRRASTGRPRSPGRE